MSGPVLEYRFWKAPTDGLPEFNSGGHGVSIIPGFGQWVLLHPSRGEFPAGSVPVKDVVSFLENHKPL